MARVFAALLLLAAALGASVCLLYTRPGLWLLGIDPLALDIVNGELSFAELAVYERYGRRFTALEVEHFADVKILVEAVRRVSLGLGVFLLALAALRPLVLKAGARLAPALYVTVLLAFAGTAATLGYIRTSDLLHGLFFERGSYVFGPNLLMSRIYTNQDMIDGALFVVGATGALLMLAWAAVHAWRLTARKGSTTTER